MGGRNSIGEGLHTDRRLELVEDESTRISLPSLSVVTGKPAVVCIFATVLDSMIVSEVLVIGWTVDSGTDEVVDDDGSIFVVIRSDSLVDSVVVSELLVIGSILDADVVSAMDDDESSFVVICRDSLVDSSVVVKLVVIRLVVGMTVVYVAAEQ